MSLQGTLSTLGITEVLEFMAERDFTGQLDITTASGTASYLLIEGDVGMAEFDFVRGSGTDAAEATYYVLAEEDGEFFFEEQEVTADEDGEKVDDILDRASKVAGRWADVEEEIPTTSHILIRNSQLGSSVTIEPEWWRVLEVLGTGRTTMELSTELDLGILDASNQALEMVQAGLLVVSDEVAEPAPAPIEPAAIEEEEEEEVIEQTQAAAEEMPAPPIMASAEEAPVAEASAEEAPVAEEFVAEAPVAEEFVAEAPVAEEFVAEVDEAPLAEEIVAGEQAAVPEDHAPALQETEINKPANDGAVVLGFSNNADQVDDLSAPVIDDDGWSTSAFSNAGAAPVPETAPTVEQAPEVAATVEETIAPMSFEQPDYLGDDAAAPAIPMSFSDNIDAPMELEETASFDPSTFDASAPFEDAGSFDTSGLEPVAEADTSGLIGMDSSFNDTGDSGAVADEAMGDLAFLNEDLDSQATVADLPVPEQSSPAQASPIPNDPAGSVPELGESSDPFGALSDLVVDEEPEAERGSVLKFLRRD